jgi:hypothetical protein
MNPIMVVTLAIHWDDREGHVCENARMVEWWR